MSTNNKISNLISSQMPFFVRNDHEKFVSFVEAYYEFLEQNGNLVDRAQALKTGFDVDESIDLFVEHLNAVFLKLIPDNIAADKALLLKNVKDFYRARGTEKSIEFLLRVLFGSDTQDATFYYPKRDVLRASDGKWFVEKSLKFFDSRINGVSNTDFVALQNFEGKKITGNISGATAFVEKIETYYDGIVLIRELKLSNQYKDFSSGETIFTTFEENGQAIPISANIYGGIINSVAIQRPGTRYVAGTQVPVESNTGSGAIVQIDEVSAGNVKSVFVVYGGAGFRNNDSIIFTVPGTATGSGANANVSVVLDNGSVHPNSYNIVYSTINLVANVNIGNSLYPALNTAQTDPANAAISQSMSFFVYGNTGPIVSITVLDSGNNYSITPNVSVVANSSVSELGILGRMNIVNAGTGYSNSDTIQFINVIGGYGTGAAANVVEVDANGGIIRVAFTTVPGFLPGGSGYNQNHLPIANVVSSNGSGANIQVTSLLAHGEVLRATSDVLGAIRRLSIISGGIGYDTVPTLNLTSLGDGTAQANATIVTGVYTYPGRYLNDDGHLSGYNFLEDRDYYQDFSYVVRTNQSIEKYRKYLKDLIHPAGLKLFGEYLKVDEGATSSQRFQETTTVDNIFVLASYKALANTSNNNTVVEVTTTRNITGIANAYVEFISNERIRSNLTLLVDPLTTGLLSTTGNLVSREEVANTSNLEARVAVGNDQTRIELVTFTPVAQTSNIEIRTSNSIASNIVNFVKYTEVANTSNVEVKVRAGRAVNTIELVKYTAVAQTSNIEVRTGSGVNTNTASLVVYTLLNTLSNVRVNTAVGSATNTATLVKEIVSSTSTSNLRANSTVSVGNTINLIRLENEQAVSNLGVNTFTTVEGGATNVIDLIRFVGVNTISNLVISTPAAVFSSNVASIYRVVNVSNTSNLEVRTGFGDANNETREIRFVRFTEINKEANVVVSSPLTPTIVVLPGFASNLAINTGTTVSNTVNLVRLVETLNTSNLLLFTDNALPGFTTTNFVRFSDTIGNSNVFFTSGYSLNIANQTHIVLSSNQLSNTILVTPEVGANLVANNFRVGERSWVSAWRQNSNTYFANGYTIRISGTNYTVSNSAPNSASFNVSPAISANLVGNTFTIRSHDSNGNTSYLIVGTVRLINNTSNLRVNTSIGTTTTGVIFDRNVVSSNVAIQSGYIINIGNAYTVNVVSVLPNSRSAVVSPAIPGNLRLQSVRVISFSNTAPLSSSNVYFDAGYTISVNGRNFTVNSANQANSTIFIEGEIATNTLNSNVFVRSYYKPENLGNSNVAFGTNYTINVGSKNTVTISSASANSNIAYLVHGVPGNLANATILVVSQYRDEWAGNANVFFANGYTLNIVSNGYVISSVSNTSNVIRFVTDLPGSIVGNSIFVQSYFTKEIANNSNVPIGIGYRLNINGSTYIVTSANGQYSNLTVTPLLPGGIFANTLTVDTYYKDQWAANSNVALDLGYRLNIAGNTHIVTSLSSNSSTITVTPAIQANLFNSAIVIEPYFREEWIANANLTIGTNYTINVGGANTVTITGSSRNSATINVTPALTGGLNANTLTVVSFYKNLTASQSNVAFDIGYVLNIGGANTVTVTGFNPSSNTITVSPPLSGNIANSVLTVSAYYKPQNLSTSNVFFGDGYTLNINAQVMIGNTSNLYANTSSNASVNTISLVRLVLTQNTSNLRVNTGSGGSVTSLRLVRLIETPNTSNLTISTGPGVANVVNISAWAQNSNVFFSTGYTINVANANTVVVTDWMPTSNQIAVTPALPANLSSARLWIYERSFADAWLGNSNVFATNTYSISVNGVNAVINTSSQSNNQINLIGSISGNLVGNVLTIFERSWVAANLRESNVFFANGYTISVNGVNTVITSADRDSSTILVTPGVAGNIVGNVINIISYASEVTVTSSNQSSNTLRITPAISGDITNNTIYVKSFYKDMWLSNSNVAFSNGYVLTVGGVDVEIIDSGSNSSRAITRTNPPSGLANGVIVVKSFYKNQWAGNSNVAIGNNYVLNINNQSVLVVRSGSNSNVLSIAPGITGNLANARIVVEAFYKNQWLQNSNTYITTGDTLIVGNTNTVIGISAANSSKITFGIGLAGNTINANVTVVRPIELSNGFFTVTANGSNAFIYVEEGKKVNANGTLFASI